jgi:hypothetical protein
MKLSLGVIDVPEPEGGTTYSTAVDLEARYGLFSNFAEFDESKIVSSLEDSIAGAIETMMQGGKVKDPFAAATSQIDQDFRDFLSNSVIEKMGVAGVPTKAALEGKSLRFKGRLNATTYVKGKRGKSIRVYGARRPSFIDSGVLQASFKSWVQS